MKVGSVTRIGFGAFSWFKLRNTHTFLLQIPHKKYKISPDVVNIAAGIARENTSELLTPTAFA